MQIINKEFLELGIAKGDEVSEKQLILLDLNPNNISQWQEKVMGKNISDARAELFVLLRGINTKTNQEKVIQNYKNLQNFRNKDHNPIKEIKATNADVTIYCDGGCSPNPGKSGSGIAIYVNGKVSELWYGLFQNMGTNNTAELNALYHSLLRAKQESEVGNKVDIKCDSMYAINCISTWAISWERNNWTKKGGEIKNLDIIKEAYYLYSKIKNKINLSHIKAHAGIEGNELADRMTIYARDTKCKKFVKYGHFIDVKKILKY
jgi:ribonuclease HI